MLLVIKMKYIKELAKNKTFTIEDVNKLIPDRNQARNFLSNATKNGYIARIKKNLYSVINIENERVIANKYEIASNITPSSFISHHSAFEFYNLYNQVTNSITVSSITKFNDFEYEHETYKHISTNTDIYTIMINDIKVSTIERTIVDSIKDSGKLCELEEILNCINYLNNININDVLNYLKFLDNKILYKKVGIILSLFKDNLNIPDSFFKECLELAGNVKGYFENTNKLSHIYNSEWKIYMPKGYENLINKE